MVTEARTVAEIILAEYRERDRALLKILQSDSNVMLGWRCEMMMIYAMTDFRTTTAKAWHRSGTDLILIDEQLRYVYRVEVKCSRRNADGNYKWCLRKDDKHGFTSIDNSDIVVMTAVADDGTMTMLAAPASELRGRKFLELPGNLKTYRGKYTKYFIPDDATWSEIIDMCNR